MNLLSRIYTTSNISFLSKAVIRYLSVGGPLLNKMSVSQYDKGAGKRIVWLDMEMTGLDVEKDVILEVTCLVTDDELNILAEGPELVLHQPDHVLENMNDWCIAQHRASGLTEASKKSKTSLADAEKQMLKFISAHVPQKKCPLAGNSVYMDRVFLMKYMPQVNDYLHYRIIDVSTIKELSRRWFPKKYSRIPQKAFKHRALEDIKDSIKELQYYRTHVFKSNDIDII